MEHCIAEDISFDIRKKVLTCEAIVFDVDKQTPYIATEYETIVF